MSSPRALAGQTIATRTPHPKDATTLAPPSTLGPTPTGLPVSAATSDRRQTDRRKQPRAKAARTPAIAPRIPPKKPMAQTRRVSLFANELNVRLAPAAFELLLQDGKLVSEGETVLGTYAGSTMLKVDLAKCQTRISDAPTSTTATILAALYPADERIRARARKLATREARRIAKTDLQAPTVDVVATAVAKEVHISFNVEAQLKKDNRP